MTLGLAIPTVEEIERLALDRDRSDLAEKDLPTLSDEIRDHKEQAERYHRLTLFHFVEMGRRIIEVKSRLPHGEFLPFLSDEVHISQPQAWRLMHLARNEHHLADLPAETSVRGALEVVEERRQAARPAPPPVAPRSVHLPPSVVLEHADAADLPVNDGLADLIVTSPPYGLGIAYADTDDSHGYASYMNDYVPAWCAELYRVSAVQGRVCLNVPLDVTRGGRQPMHVDWVQRLVSVGFSYRATIVWNEDNVNKRRARGSVDSPGSINVFAPVETIIVVHKGAWERSLSAPHDLAKTHPGECVEECTTVTCGHQRWLAWGGGTGVWTFPGESRQWVRDICPVPFPEELPRRCIQLFSYRDDVVLDPFVGSGTTVLTAAHLGRAAYGFDHSEQYLQGARERVERELRRGA